MNFVDDWSVGGEVPVAGLDLGVLLEVALGLQVVGDLGRARSSLTQSGMIVEDFRFLRLGNIIVHIAP